MGKPSFGTFRIASAYIGTVVGAGFSSGQEILRFFTAYGRQGIWGVAVVTLLFFFFGYTALLIGRGLKADSYRDVVRFTNGKLIGSAIDVVITLFLFGGLSAMFAGAGAVFEEQFGIAPVWGTLLMTAASLLTVLSGTKGVVNAISALVPLLIIMTIYIFIKNLSGNSLTEYEMETALSINGATPNWLLSAFNYASYNLIIGVAVLAPIGQRAKNKKSLFTGALLGGSRPWDRHIRHQLQHAD